MLPWVFSCFIGFCLFQSHVKAQLEGDGSPTCTCVDNNAEYCNLVREKCKSEWRDFEDPCYVNNAYECSGCNGGPCDCVYNTVNDTVLGVCQTEGTERKRYIQDKDTGTKRRKPNRIIKKYPKDRKSLRPYPMRKKPNQARPYPNRRKPSHARPYPMRKKPNQARPYPNRRKPSHAKPHPRRKKPNQARPYPNRRKPSHAGKYPRIRRRRSGSKSKPDDDCYY